MLGLLFECFAEAFGLTRRVRPLVLALVTGASVGFVALSFAEGGPRGLVVLALVLAFTVFSAWHVLAARAALGDASRRGLDDPRQRPEPPRADLPPTALALRRLAVAVDAARRAKYLDAAQALEGVDRSKLRDDEERLFEGARALVSLGLGDGPGAAQHAERALPTLSEDIDSQLGRTLVTEAWSDAGRLRAIDDAWAERGVTPGTKRPLPRLRAILRLRIDTSAIEGVEAWEAKALADEARAIGDEALAADLESRARPTAYR